jgi:hypothetical protein
MRKIPKVKGEKKMSKVWAIVVLLALATVLTTPAFASSVPCFRVYSYADMDRFV